MNGVVHGLGGGGGYKIKLFKFNPPPPSEILSYASGNTCLFRAPDVVAA